MIIKNFDLFLSLRFRIPNTDPDPEEKTPESGSGSGSETLDPDTRYSQFFIRIGIQGNDTDSMDPDPPHCTPLSYRPPPHAGKSIFKQKS